MIRRDRIRKRAARPIGLALLCLALSGATGSAQAENCSDYPGGVLDGFAGTIAPSQLQIDRNCTIRNFPASNPLSTNFSFFTSPGQTDDRWLVIFDNVVHVGNMSCNDVLDHRIWFTNGSSSKIKENCQNLLIPVEKIDKQNPAGQTTATVGVPFTYTLTMPVLFDPATGTVINTSGSLDDLHGVTVWDDLDATGADLTYVSHVAYVQGTGAPVSHTFSNAGGLLTFDNFEVIPAGEQIVIELTVVLDDSPGNVPGTQFINTAKWDFGRLIDGVFYEPLPGEWGITPPMTIGAPQLVVTKTGPATLGRTLNLGEWGTFGVDVQNTGLSAAWDVAILDRLPDGAMGGMCDRTPELLSARVFAADGVTPVPGKGPLVAGTDYTLTYSGPPTCELSLTMLTSAASIGPGERLIITYRTQLDPDSQDGITLTNVAGVTQWFNADASNPDRVAFTRALTDGTIGVLDHEDAHTVTVRLYGYFFEKTVANLTTGVSSATTAAPGDTLRYTLRLQSTDVALDDLTFYDDLGELNAGPVFVPGTLALVSGSIPPGADTSNTNPSGGTNGAGIVDVRNLSVPAHSEISIQFDVTLDPTVADGTVVANQSDLVNTVKLADSDDPNQNGQADPSVVGDEDPTRIMIDVATPGALLKANTQATAAVGAPFSYRITVPETPFTFPLYDVRIVDDLTASSADLRFVSVSKVSSSGAWTPVNTGTDTSLVIEYPSGGIDIPAGEQIVVEITVVLENTPTNVAGLSFTNTAHYTYDRINGNPASQQPGAPGSSPPMTIVEPALTLEKSGPAQMAIGTPDTLILDFHNPSGTPAWNATLTDQLPDGATGGTCDVAPSGFSVQLYEADGTTPVGAALVENTDFTVSFSAAPTCSFTLTVLSAAGTIGPDQRLIVRYQTQLDADTQDGVALTNVAGATQWFSAAGSSSDRRTYTRALTDGTVGVLDHEDAHTVAVAVPPYLFEKTVMNVTTGEDPATTATPGDRLRYRIRVENLGTDPLANLTLFDELDRLNAVAAFAPGTLQVITLPAGADASNTNATGGTKGTGVLDVRDLSLAGGASMLVEIEITLAQVIASGTYVTNQSQLLIGGAPFAYSDDPGVNGPADPLVAGDEDPTRVLIASAPAFRIEKISTDLTGDPAILLAGEALRYTLTVKNIGTADATDAVLRDAVPANTQYVASSTRLNGTPVSDGPANSAPLEAGIAIWAPENPTPGTMRADASATPDNVATIVFDVVVDAGVANGTVISNQGFVSAAAGGLANQPSDDPRTPAPDDPTRNVVGNAPLLFAAKRAALLVDAGTPGVVDPADVLHYTISISNSGAIAATGVVVTDSVPANTTYVADSTTLDGAPVGQPDGGAFPLAAGVSVGTIDPGQTATLEFDLRVNDGVPGGTLISNQALVTSAELPDLLTDGDGNPQTGPEPTVVLVGAGQQLAITKQVSVVGGGPALPGAQVEYVVTVLNVAAVPAFDVVITDDLGSPVPGQQTYVASSASMNGSTAGISVVSTLIRADYSATYGPLPAGTSVVLRFRAEIAAGLAAGTRLTNTGVVTWNTPPQTASASVSFDVGGVPGVAALNGTVWHDADFDASAGAGERRLESWIVDLYRNDAPFLSTTTDAAGGYAIGAIPPNDTDGTRYELRFRAPEAGANSASLGTASSPFTNGPQWIRDIVVSSGANLQNLHLPITPNGVVYDAVGRGPIAGATLILVEASSGSPVPSLCFDDPVQQGQITRPGGYYKFDLNFADAACPSGASYLIAVTAPASGYAAGYSQLIPPTSSPATPPLSVPTCPGGADDAVPATLQYCEATPSELAPPSSVPARSTGTRYHVHLTLDASQVPGSSQIFNNHVPLDPLLDGAIALTKTTPHQNVSRGQLVPYEITLSNTLGTDLADVSIVDRIPSGFRYVEGSARIDGVRSEPTASGGELVWTSLSVPPSSRRVLQLLLGVGAGVTEGEYTNRARAISSLTGAALSGWASATVRVVPDPTFDCTDVLGKVFDDANRNGVQDGEEGGLPGVRLVTARGLIATTDEYGRFHITCAITPREGRGSNFILKLDDRTLPSGFRMSTRQVLVQRATRGKALRFSFGASIHRIVGLDTADPVFEPGSTELREQWKPRIALLIEELKKAPATLRLSYIADVEDASLVERRLEALESQIMAAWKAQNCCYRLSIEPEVFWRRGAPPGRPELSTPESR